MVFFCFVSDSWHQAERRSGHQSDGRHGSRRFHHVRRVRRVSVDVPTLQFVLERFGSGRAEHDADEAGADDGGCSANGTAGNAVHGQGLATNVRISVS